MRIAGVGYRHAATIESLTAALEAAGGPQNISALATMAGKEGPPLAELAARLGIPVLSISLERLGGQPTAGRSQRVEALVGVESVAEAAALAACGPGARLLVTRVVSPDRMATAAIAATGDSQ